MTDFRIAGGEDGKNGEIGKITVLCLTPPVRQGNIAKIDMSIESGF
jgi:hypothetical protein